MQMSNNHTVISRFLSKEIEEVYKKYSNITQEEANLVFKLIEQVEENQLNLEPYLSYENTKGFAVALYGEENIDIIKLYLLLTSDINIEVEIEAVREMNKELEDKGYTQIDDILIYQIGMDQEFQELAEEKLEGQLEDVDKVIELFDEEEVANMWIFKTSQLMAARQYILDNGWEEILDIKDIQKGYSYSSERKRCQALNLLTY